MRQKDVHTNIMLDLECAAINTHNPAIIELAAVYFDIDTGEELDSLCTPVSLQSSLEHGLITDDNTLGWLKREIPQTLKTSQECCISLPQAIMRISKFVKKSIRETESRRIKAGLLKPYKSQPMIWGNGSMADNTWIRSAYKACSMEVPWEYYNDMCVRTVVKQVWAQTGKDYSLPPLAPPRQGLKHDALSDCRFQIAYIVLARNEPWSEAPTLDFSAIGPAPGTSALAALPANGGTSPTRSTPIGYPGEKKPPGSVRKTMAVHHSARRLLSPETSFSRGSTQAEDDSLTAPAVARPVPLSKRQLLTPETSFNGKEFDYEDEGPPVKRVDYRLGSGPEFQEAEWLEFLEQEAKEP
ncbi:hypothetical protein LHYA1_G005001 [Lachnellula hyalina]|uniref:3'-5' exoribonuclease Rv2179c-like domain-containing protein n=1 Tax=Lachnellula hyalina TaxID=1316788 RepID=A0A8H8QXT4_9HELO|nr:uncharacterized protein LHYA1_G005001 [Lachnellula hyalina]TVY24823.1 hypothetical protein LHYA1_G005001 [Lachnellula hyalina]